VIDFAMDIIEVEGKPLAKRGKMSGSKRVLRCDRCYQFRMIPYKDPRPKSQAPKCDCGKLFKDILLPIVEDGKIVGKRPSTRKIREYVLKQLVHFSLA